ncbi:MAG: alkane 1-monooxygenase [Pseudomarimonas sp.]
MNITKRLGFLFAFVVPALMPAAAFMAGGDWLPRDVAAWSPLVFLFVLLPLADFALGHDSVNPNAEEAATLDRDLWFRGLTLACVPIQLGLLAWSAHYFVSAEWGVPGLLGWVFSQGVVSSVLAINVAHELIHKDNRLEQWAGGVLLTSVGYHGFKIEHIRGHHVHVSTPEDASSARFDQSLWHFLPRALLRNSLNAWRLESQRLRKQGLSALHWRNELISWTAFWLIGIALFAWLLGPAGAFFFVAQGLVAAISLEIINYIEHYGLERKKLPTGRYERTTHLHSWNSDFRLSNLLLFQLQRHSDHHETPRRRYQALLHHADSPQLPGGYASMFILAMFPPLWKRLINPRVLRFRENAASPV